MKRIIRLLKTRAHRSGFFIVVGHPADSIAIK